MMVLDIIPLPSCMTPSTDKALCIMSTVYRNLDLSKLMLHNNHTQILEQSVIMEDVQQHL